MDKTYRWLKIGTDFYNSPEIRRLLSMKNGDRLVVVYQQVLLLSAEYDGDLSHYKEMGDLEQEVSRAIGVNIRTIRSLFEKLREMFLLVDSKFVQFQEFSGKETDEARRKRKLREKRRSLGNTDVEADEETEEKTGKHGTMSQNVPPSKKEERREKREERREKREEYTPLPPSKGAEVEAAEKEESSSEKKSPKKKSKTGREVYLEFAGENEELRQALMDFLEMREKTKKPVTEKAARLSLSKLQAAGPPGEWVAIVDQSTERCWQTFYSLQDEAPPGKSPSKKMNLYPEYEAMYQEHDKWNLFQEVGHDSPH